MLQNSRINAFNVMQIDSLRHGFNATKTRHERIEPGEWTRARICSVLTFIWTLEKREPCVAITLWWESLALSSVQRHWWQTSLGACRCLDPSQGQMYADVKTTLYKTERSLKQLFIKHLYRGSFFSAVAAPYMWWDKEKRLERRLKSRTDIPSF